MIGEVTQHWQPRFVSLTNALGAACEEFQADPLGVLALPNWNRITSAIPDFLERYREIVDAESGHRAR